MDLAHSSVVILLAGIAFLLFGLSLASESLQKIAANRIRRILNKLDESGIVGLAVGTVLTLLMQSSGAVTATLVNLGTASVLSLQQVMGVIIGTAIGAALTVQLISLHVADFGLPMFLTGFACAFVIKKRRFRSIFEFLMGLGLLFFGLELIRIGSADLVRIPLLAEAFLFLRTNAFVTFLVSAVLTSIFHSSTATIGVVMGFTASGLVGVGESLPWIFGANVGTASTGLLASIRGNYRGRQIAWANFLYRSASVIVFLPIAGLSLQFISQAISSPQGAIAALYMVLNVFAAMIFFPLRRFGVRLIENTIVPTDAEKEFGVKFLKRSNYESFALGLAHAKREVLEMGDFVYQMAELSIEVFRDEDPDHIIKIRSLDDKIDLLLKEIKLFLIRVSDLAPEGINQSVIDVISFGTDLEGAADTIDHHLLDLAKKKRKGRLEFSPEAWQGLEKLHQATMRSISLAVTHFQTEDTKLAEQLSSLKHEVREIEQQCRESHIARLSKAPGENMGISAIYLETVNTYLQLVEMLSRHARRMKPIETSSNRRGKS